MGPHDEEIAEVTLVPAWIQFEAPPPIVSFWAARVRYPGGVVVPAPAELLDRYAAVLADLAARHGLSKLRHGGPGTVVADVEPGRTLNDLARFELEAESLLGHEVFVVSSDAPAAGRLVGAPLRSRPAA